VRMPEPRTRTPLGAMAAMLFLALAAHPARSSAAQALPATWLARWAEPPAEDRPLQIPDGVEQMVPATAPPRPERKRARYFSDLKALGLGGVVCNVAFQDYMRSESSWENLIAGVRTCQKLGLVVWLYDEAGYPSGAAGGLVLEENPAYEAAELAFEPTRDDPFILRPAYEHTHATNNYYAARRYINLLDDRAVRSFIAHTHEAYWQRLKPYFGTTIQAMFTDEPSLIAVNLGQIPADARKKVPVVDPPDPAVAPRPAVPWAHDLPQRYRERYGEDLMPQRRGLFVGDAPADRKVRRQFWALIADLVAERYFGAVQAWCSRHRVASSGHTLWEEALLHHPALEGNGLQALARMDIPGLDVLSSDPEAVVHSGWMTAALPSSAAVLQGRRRLMTEVSDFGEKMGGRGPAGLPEMQATAAWQAAWGVTDFTLYYSITDRSPEQLRAYCDFVGRLNAILKPARPTPETLLYYPIYDLWAEYRPVAEPLRVESQSPRAQRIVSSFLRLGQALQRSQLPFALIDHEWLAAARVEPDGTLAIHDQRFATLLLPQDTELPPAAARTVERFREKGGRVLADQQGSTSLSGPFLIATLKPAHRLAPASERVALGLYIRDGRRIVVLVNVGREPYEGHLVAPGPAAWQVLDPASGAIRAAESDPPGRVRLSLAARQTLLLVQD